MALRMLPATWVSSTQLKLIMLQYVKAQNSDDDHDNNDDDDDDDDDDDAILTSARKLVAKPA